MATRSKSDERRSQAQRITVQHRARSYRLSSTELRSGQNGSRQKEKSAGAAAASYRRHDSRRHGYRGWPILPGGPTRSRRQQRPTRPRPRRRPTGEKNAADGSQRRTQRRRERRRSRRYYRRLRRRRRRSLVLLRARHGRLREWQPRGRMRRVTTADRTFKSARESAAPCQQGMPSEFRRRSTTSPATTSKTTTSISSGYRRPPRRGRGGHPS